MIELTADLIGATVEFNYGPMYGTERGIIVDCVTDQWGTHLVARTDDGATKTVNGFTTIGIGVYLIENERKINRNSPWFIPE